MKSSFEAIEAGYSCRSADDVAASRQAFARKYAHCLLVASPTAQCVTATGYFYLLPQSAVLLPFAATNRAIAGLTTLDFFKKSL
ncbi:MAG: hypothetical protein IKO40_08845 [Kiritimatiellae bacterium]|nr:hypothetical protein [Kiritimatiellia bacterium]